MKKWLKITGITALSLLLMVTLSACGKSSSSDSVQLKTKGTLTVGLEGTYSPYSYRENGKLKGFEVELAQDVAKNMGYKVKFVPTKWDSLIAGLGSKKFDVVFNNVTITNARAKKFSFTDPYIYSREVLITQKDNTTINNIDDIKGKKIVAGVGTNNETVAQDFGAKVVSSSEFTSALNLVKEGRADGNLNAREAYLSYLKDNPSAADEFKYTVIPTNKVKAAKIAGLVNKQNPALTKKINKALKELKADGTLKKLSVKYFTADITEK